jgi:glutamate synthase (ferredoxin)
VFGAYKVLTGFVCRSLSLFVQMGVAETHQVLTRNELRERVVLRADGGFRSGRDVLMASALGADEYGFGTVAMIATGCIMARVCHTNNCPVGVASQREELRARFPGAPADLVNFFHFVAEEVSCCNSLLWLYCAVL